MHQGTWRDPILAVLCSGLAMFAIVFGLIACGAGRPGQQGTVETTPTTTAMTFATCQQSAEYPGGRYAVEYDNGVCTVQRPSDVTPVTAVAYPNCDAVRAAGKAPLHAGEPGYTTTLDRDHDGTACDAK